MKDDCLKQAIQLLLKLSEDNTEYIADMTNILVNKDYKEAIKYLNYLQDGIDYLVDKLDEE